MSANTVDLKRIARELKKVRKKYDLPKTMAFVPDRLEIVLERVEKDKFSLNYQEFFGYLPDQIQDVALKITTTILTQTFGIPSDKITRLDNGVKLQLNGDFWEAVVAIIPEFLFQKQLEKSEIDLLFKILKRFHKTMIEISDMHWSWDENTANKLNNLGQTWEKVMQENPSVISEINDILKRKKVRTDSLKTI